MSQGYPAVVELAPSLLESVVQSVVERVFPTDRTVTDPRPGRGPYALIPNVRLTLSAPSVPRRPEAALIGVIATLQETSTGETGSYAIYFDVRGGDGSLWLYVELIDPARSQPISHLPPSLLHLALAGQGPIAWPIAPGVNATVRTTLGEPGRALLFVTSTALSKGRALRPSPDPIAPPLPLLRRLPSGGRGQGGGPVQVIHDEDWAAEIDEAVVRSLVVEAITGMGVIDAEGSSIQVTAIAVPRLITGGLEIELEALVDGAPCSARGPLYIGYYLERANSDVPLLRSSINAAKLQVNGPQALPGALYPLTALIPSVLLLALPGIPATLETWVYGPTNRGRARATNQGTRGPLATLVGDTLRLLPSTLETLIGRQLVVRLDFGSQGLTLGVAYRPPPRSGVTKTPLEVPLRVHTVEPAAILIGWRRPGDLFVPAPAETSVQPIQAPAPRDISHDLAIAGLAPLDAPRRRTPSATLFLSGAGLDGVISAHLVSGFHRRALSIVDQSPARLTLEWPLADAPPGLWDLEFEWSGKLAHGIPYSDRLTLRNQVRTYVMEPERRPDDRPLRVLTRGGEPVLLQLASGLLTPLAELSSLRDRLREAPATDVDVAEVEVPLATCLSQPQALAIERLGDDEFVVDAGELGRLRLRTLAVKRDVRALAEVEALLGRLPRHELG